MEVISSYRDYIQKRQQGDCVISRAECDGISVMSQSSEDAMFSILSIEENRYVLTSYLQKSHHILITNFKEETKHSLNEILSVPLIARGNLCNWEPFFYCNSNRNVLYDTYFDHYNITKEDNVTCKDVLAGISEALTEILPENITTLYIKNKLYWDCLPFIYILQSLVEHVVYLPAYKDDDIIAINKGKYTFPENVKLLIGDNAPIALDKTSSRKQLLHIPMDDVSLKAYIVTAETEENVHIMNWGQFLHDQKPTYHVGKIGIKVLKTPIFETDGYQNLFWVQEAEQGKRIGQLIYSKYNI